MLPEDLFLRVYIAKESKFITNSSQNLPADLLFGTLADYRSQLVDLQEWDITGI